MCALARLSPVFLLACVCSSSLRVCFPGNTTPTKCRVVSFWSSDPTYARHPLRFYLAGVTASAGVVGIFSHLRTVWAFHLGLRASKRLHGALLRRVLHAPVSFFDTTPVGRIVQRFSKDTDQVMHSTVPVYCKAADRISETKLTSEIIIFAESGASCVAKLAFVVNAFHTTLFLFTFVCSDF